MARSRSYAVELLKSHPVVTGIVATLAVSAVFNRVLAKKAERRNPPMGASSRLTGFGSTTLSEEQGARSSCFTAMGVWYRTLYRAV